VLLADYVVVILRGLSFAAVLQAAGGPVFLFLFAHRLESAADGVCRWCRSATIAALVLVGMHALADPARLTGDLRGMFDLSLHGVLMQSRAGATLVLRATGLVLILTGLLDSRQRGSRLALIGTALTIVSFTATGHTASSDWRWLLAPLLMLHLFAAAFWLGGLAPLLIVARRERQPVIATLLADFSRHAIRIVPLILLAGTAMAALLLNDWSALRTPYGLALIAKAAIFAILMLLAAANRWRFGPGIGRGMPAALRGLELTVLTEWILIVGVAMLTALMTSLLSPS